MTDQQPQPPQFTVAELGAKFGEPLGQAYAENIILGKQLQLQQAQILVLQARIAELEAQQPPEVVEIEPQQPRPGSMSPEAAAIAAEGSAIAQAQTYEKDLTDAESAAALGSINA